MVELNSAGRPHTPVSDRRRTLLRAVLGAVALAPLVSWAQEQAKVWRIGFLAADASSTRVYDGFQQGMRELGYVLGKNCSIAWRFADGRYERLPSLAAELVRLKDRKSTRLNSSHANISYAVFCLKKKKKKKTESMQIV